MFINQNYDMLYRKKCKIETEKLREKVDQSNIFWFIYYENTSMKNIISTI